jgi:hypothetical protein
MIGRLLLLFGGGIGMCLSATGWRDVVDGSKIGVIRPRRDELHRLAAAPTGDLDSPEDRADLGRYWRV